LYRKGEKSPSNSSKVENEKEDISGNFGQVNEVPEAIELEFEDEPDLDDMLYSNL
jgi:hypothetical protein